MIERSPRGHISLSTLRDDYRMEYGTQIQCRKMTNWIGTSNLIGTRNFAGTNDRIAYSLVKPPPRSAPSNEFFAAMSGVEEANILQMIRESEHGHISLSNLRDNYKQAYGVILQCPKRKMMDWIDTSSLIETRKLGGGTNDKVAFERGRRNGARTSPPPPRPRNDYDPPLPQSQLRAIVEDAEVESAASSYFSTSDDEVIDEEPQISCDDIVAKLMRYAGGCFKPTVVHQQTKALLDILPMHWSDALACIGLDKVSDISLDLGRRPYCWHNHQRQYLCEDTYEVVEEHAIEGIVSSLQGFGDDNRAGIDGQLHRISCIRNNSNGTIGLTIRVGRHIEGNSDMIRDLLEDTDKSILLLGEPGSGKTTIVRDVAKILSQKKNVFIVDTSNEIAGDGNIPHSCVGDSRRMMVKSLSSQADTMIECVQNHTPEVMIIDEIGRKREVEAAQTSKNRGVRMIASAHGDLRSLIKNKDIRGLIGGLETVTLGDTEAKDLQKKSGSKSIQKQLTTRATSPIFEIIIELKRGRLHEWHVVTNSAKAVDDILLGEKYEIQNRMRCMSSGNIFVEHIKN
ncbi:hypothetical protein ACHAXR_006084 [Thalassiosira sp. AJA248-18]